MSNVLEIIIKGDNQSKGAFDGAHGSASGLASALGTGLKVAAGAAAAALIGLGAGLASSVQAAMDAQGVDAQLDAVLRSTGGAAGMTKDAVLALSDKLQGLTRFEDEAITSAQSMLLTFTNIGKDVFPAATETVLNMSQALGQDLKSSSIQLGKALNDPITGITALQRVGVSFTEEQKAAIQAMVDMGDTAGAQKLILKELEVEFGNSARAAGETYAGKLDILKNKFGNIKETIGMALLPALTDLATTFINVLDSPEVKNAIASIVGGIGDFAAKAGPWIKGVIDTLSGQGGLSGTLGSLQGAFDTALAGIKTALDWFKTNVWDVIWPDIQKIANDVWDRIGEKFTLFRDQVLPIITQAFGGVVQWFTDNWPAIKDTMQTVWDGITAVLDVVFGADGIVARITEGFGIVLSWVNENWPAIQTVLETVWGAILTVVQTVINTVVPFITDEFGKVKSWVDENWPLIQQTIETVLNAIRDFVEIALGAINGFWDKHGEAITDVIDGVWKVISGTIDGVLTAIGGIIKAAMQIINGDWDDAWETIKGTAKQIWETDIKQIIDGALLIITGLFTGFYLTLKTQWDNAWGGLKNGLSTIWTGITTAIQTGVDNAKRAVLDVVDKIVQAAESLPDKFYEIGQNVVRGLVNGIESFIGDVAGVISKLLGSLPQWAKQLLGIASPSSVFQEIGENVGAGLIAGLDASQAGVQSAAAGMVSGIGAGALPIIGMSIENLVDMSQTLARVIRQIMDALNTYFLGNVETERIMGFTQSIEAITRLFTETLPKLAEIQGQTIDISGLVAWIETFVVSLKPAMQRLLDSLYNNWWGKDELDRVKGSVSTLKEVVGTLEVLLQTGEHLATYKGVSLDAIAEQFSTMLGHLKTIVLEIQKMHESGNFGGAIAQAGIFAQNMVAVMGMFREVITTAQAVGDFKPVEDFSTRLTALMVDATLMVNELVKFAGQWPDGVESVKGLQGLVAHVGALATAIKAIGDWTPLEGFATKATAFFADAGEMVRRLVAFAGQWPDGVKAVEGLNELVGHVAAMVGAVKAIGEWAPVADFTAKLDAFIDDIGLLIPALVIASAAMPAGVEAAGKLMASVGAIVQPIKTAVDALKALSAYVGIEDPETVLGAFIRDLFAVVEQLDEFADDFEAEGLAVAAKIMASVGQVMAPIKSAIDGLNALDTYTGVHNAPAVVAIFAADMTAVVKALATFAEQFDLAGAEAAGKVMTAVGKIVSPLKSAVEALGKISEYKKIANVTQVVDNFIADLGEVITKVSTFALGLDPVHMDAIAAIGADVNVVADAVKDSAAAMKAVGDYAKVEGVAAAWTKLSDDMTSVILGLYDIAKLLEPLGNELIDMLQALADALRADKLIQTFVVLMQGALWTTQQAMDLLLQAIAKILQADERMGAFVNALRSILAQIQMAKALSSQILGGALGVAGDLFAAFGALNAIDLGRFGGAQIGPTFGEGNVYNVAMHGEAGRQGAFSDPRALELLRQIRDSNDRMAFGGPASGSVQSDLLHALAMGRV